MSAARAYSFSGGPLLRLVDNGIGLARMSEEAAHAVIMGDEWIERTCAGFTGRGGASGRVPVSGRVAVSGRSTATGRVPQNDGTFTLLSTLYNDGVSDWTPGTMGAVTSAGTTPPVLTLTGTATSYINITASCTLAGNETVATVNVLDNGSAVATGIHPSAGFAYHGITGSWAAGNFATNNTWAANVRIASIPSRESAQNTINADRTLGQATAARQPTLAVADSGYNSKPVLSFQASPAGMFTASAFPFTQPYTIYIVGEGSAGGGIGGYFLASSDLAVGIRSGRGAKMFASTNLAETNLATTAWEGTRRICACVFNGASSAICLSTSTASPTGDAGSVSTSSQLIVGANNLTTGGSSLVGKVGAILIRSTAHSQQQRRQFGGALQAIYGGAWA